MKNCRIYLIAALLLGAVTTFAGEQSSSDSLASQQVDYRFALGVQLGTDVGGAIPVPFKYIPETFNPYPKLDLSLGAKLTFPLTSRWDIGAEVTYKTITMNADARVENQKFQDGDLMEYYSGTAEMRMDFTMLEVPVYTKYSLRNLKDKKYPAPLYFIPPRLYGLMNAECFIEDAEDIIALWKDNPTTVVTFPDEPHPLAIRRMTSHRRWLDAQKQN